MALDRLAPDQRAVVQLVLQQERSYDELADLLGISADAVRERARRGLERLDEGAGVDEESRGRVVDYLLGQQTVSGREATRALLTGDEAARRWAKALSSELSGVARSPLPDVPGAQGPAVREPAAAPPEEPRTATARSGGAPATEEVPAPVRARPRPKAAGDRPARPAGAPRRGGDERPKSSLVGGALLIGGVALVVAALIAWLIWGNDDEGGERAGNGATPTATATPSVQPAGQIQLRAPGGGDARGQMTIFVSEGGDVAFTIEGNRLPTLERGEAYALWLTGGGRPRRLGFITDDTPGDGRIGSSGPQPNDAERFPQWLASAQQVLLTRETTQEAEEPGTAVLRGAIPGAG